jgi:hypothetical protein
MIGTRGVGEIDIGNNRAGSCRIKRITDWTIGYETDTLQPGGAANLADR